MSFICFYKTEFYRFEVKLYDSANAHVILSVSVSPRDATVNPMTSSHHSTLPRQISSRLELTV